MSTKRNAFFMKRALDDDNLRDALRFSAAMLGELRTSLLGPQRYYELYMQAFDELRHLEVFFGEEHKKGRSFADLYELVQHAGNVLPRLYLMCTVGACFIRSGEGYAKDVLRDLAEMCKGVQHPTRGLFLRSYLCQVCRTLLPDVGSPYEGKLGGTTTDALDFLLLNFTEMNKLWVRMQHQGSVRDRERRERERQQLADLVGKNLTYIGQLEGLDFKMYSESVLPRVVQQVVQCKDGIAQQYLMQCLIQGFPDDFHLGTLDKLLTTCSELQGDVKIFLIMSSLMDRLTRYAKEAGDGAAGLFDRVVAFDKLRDACTVISSAHSQMPVADVVAMYVSLLGFTVNVYRGKLDVVDSVLQACCQALSKRTPITDPAAEKKLVALLTIPVTSYDVITVLGLQHYPQAMALLQPATCKDMAVQLIDTVLKNGTLVTSPDKTSLLLGFVAPLIEDDDEDADEEDIVEKQSQVARLLHQLRSDDPGEQDQMLRMASDRLLQGHPSRYQHTLPSLVVNAVQLVHRLASGRPQQGATAEAGEDSQEGSGKQEAKPSPKDDVDANSVLLFVHATIGRLVDLTPAEQVLQLYLMAGLAASEVAHLEVMTYEFYEQAFVIYEESIPDSRAQVTALQSIIGSLVRCNVLGPDNRDALVHKAIGYCAKLLKKTDQCRAICLCSHLFWQTRLASQAVQGVVQEPGAAAAGAEDAASIPSQAAAAEGFEANGAATDGEAGDSSSSSTWANTVRDADGVMACLKRALKVANAAQQQSSINRAPSTEPVALFVEILNHYLYFFDQGLSTITPSIIQNLLELVANEMAAEACQKDKALASFYANTYAHVTANQQRTSKLTDKYKDLQLPAAGPDA